MTARSEERSTWTIQEAERLLMSLQGVVSARVVARPGGEIDEVHMLTTDDIRPKQTVRNVESALLAQLDLSVDHRKISVAQTTEAVAARLPEPVLPVQILAEPALSDTRVLFYGHQVETERSNHVKHRVEVEWQGQTYVGEARAADLPKPRLEAATRATLDALEQALQEKKSDGRREVTLSLDGVRLVEAFERRFVLVAVHAMSGRHVARLAGTTVADESSDRAAILATLQATDRWVRGLVD
ncbi:MAG: hypothetical protein HKO77_06975 [Gemmatimonadetes bacterium]|nr:hypothetical protein [Gemmatimonadota bacterium]NNL49136.1 hypothetical protein [Acidimicrobiia bacterium]